MRRSTGFILKSVLLSMLVGTTLILAASAYTPNDPYWGNQWGPKKIDATKAWNYQKGSTTITVAILDTGIDYNHQDLSGRVIKGWNFINNSNVVMDDYNKSHGTRVAGISGAIINNSKGIAGMAQTKLLAVKVCDFLKNCPWPAITNGIYYAANNGSKIISMSIGKEDYDFFAEEAVDYAFRNKGALLVSISGNGGFDGVGDNVILYPGNFSQVIAVGATKSDDSIAIFSNYGSKLELVAPGNDTFSTIRNNGYEGGAKYGSGTSFAAPHVSGVAALVWSQYPALSNIEVRHILKGTAVDLGDAGRDIYYGYGRVNASAAVISNMLSRWRYNRRLTITGSTAGPQTNYQMKLKVYNSAGTDTPGNIYLNGNAKSDFSDLRFTKSDRATLLDYWIESLTPGISAVVWVEVDSIPASPSMTDIYIYYGNAVAPSMSIGEETFQFFDDFSSNSIGTKWTIQSGSWSISDGVLYHPEQTGGSVIRAIMPTVLDYEAVGKTLVFGSNGWRSTALSKIKTDGVFIFEGLIVRLDAGTQQSELRVNTVHDYNMPINNYQWYNLRMRVSQGLGYGWVDNVLLHDGISASSNQDGVIGFYSYYGGSQWDYVFVKKFVNPEPTWGA